MTDDETEPEELERLLESAFEELPDPDADEPATAPLLEVAGEVEEVVEQRETGDLVEAAGVDLPEDAEPETIPEAVKRGEEASVATLRTALLLSELAGTEDEEAIASTVADLREARQRAANAAGSTPVSAEANGDDDGGREANGDDDGDGEADGDGATTLQEQLEAELTDAIEEFRGDVDSLRGELEAEAGGDEDEDGAGSDGDGEASGDDREDAADGEGESEPDSTGGRPRFTAGRLSTVPSSRRGGPPKSARLSTVRGNASQE